MARVTIKDIARKAGVSVATVSNAINGKELTKAETREYVLKIAESMNYVPNANARTLQAGCTKTIGFLVSSLSGPFFISLISNMQKVCEENNYTMVTVYSDNPDVIMQHLLGKGLDGAVIYYGQDRIAEKEIKQIQNAHIPVVFLDREIACSGVSSVVYASYESGVEVTEYLLQKGHKRIFFLSGSIDVYDAISRKAGYLDTMKKYGFDVPEEYILEGEFEEDKAHVSVHNYLEKVAKGEGVFPDAIIAANDLSAVGCIKALAEHGYNVPEDVSVVSFDDIELAQYFRPALTTVHNPIERQGEVAVSTLMDMMQSGATDHGVCKKLEGTLVVRESCGERMNG